MKAPAVVSASGGTVLQQRIEDNQERAISMTCSHLQIEPDNLLTDDKTSHPEFMKVLTTVAVSANQYFDLVTVWKCKQSFIKQGSKVHTTYQNGEKILTSLKQNLRELCSMKVVSSNLTLQLKSCQEKLCKISSLLPIFFDTKRALEEAIPLIQACIRSQKQRSFNKATASNEYIFSASNCITLTWDAAVDCLHEAEVLNDKPFSPLTVQQLALFSSIKDKCHWNGLCCIPDYVICHEYNLDINMKDAIGQVIQQLEQQFPVVSVKSGERHVLIDYTEMIFNPGLVHQVMVLDKKADTEESSEQEPESVEQGIFFYKRTGPVPLQKKFSQLLTVMLDFIKLHGFAAHVRRRSGTSTTCGVRLEDIRQHVLKNVEGLTKISKSRFTTY